MDDSDGILVVGPRTGVEKGDVDDVLGRELVWAVVVVDASVDDETSSDGGESISTLSSSLARLAGGGAFVTLVISPTINCPFEFLVIVL